MGKRRDTDTGRRRPRDTVKRRDTDTVKRRPRDTGKRRPRDTDTVKLRPRDIRAKLLISLDLIVGSVGRVNSRRAEKPSAPAKAGGSAFRRFDHRRSPVLAGSAPPPSQSAE